MRTLVLVSLAACGSDTGSSHGTLKLADRSDAEIDRLVGAAGGQDMFSAEAQASQYSDATDPCPNVAIAGSVVTITGGCAMQGGLRVDGSAVLTNFDAYEPQAPYDPTKATEFDFHQLAFSDQLFTTSYDGTVHIENSFTTYDADLTATMLGITVRSQLSYVCDAASRTCNLSGDVDLAGAGDVVVGGSVQVGANTATADFRLQGVDALTAHLSGSCISWQIEGTARAKTCP